MSGLPVQPPGFELHFGGPQTGRGGFEHDLAGFAFRAKDGKAQTVVGAAFGGLERLKAGRVAIVDGDDFGQLGGEKKRFLRRIPADPLNPPKPGEEPKWGLRSYKDDPDSTTWGGEDVYDVYSLSEDTAIDGSKYKDW